MALSCDKIMTRMNLAVKMADYADPADAAAIVRLMDCYARDPMGGGEPLAARVLADLVEQLRRYPMAFSFIAHAEGRPAGLVNCFESLSTFKCRPLINIHDVIVDPHYRGRGVAKTLLQAVESEAKARGCCKLTLEVLAGNRAARSLYRRAGFQAYRLNPELGSALFWEKAL